MAALVAPGTPPLGQPPGLTVSPRVGTVHGRHLKGLWEALGDQLPPSPPRGSQKCERPDRPILYYFCTTETSPLLFLHYRDQADQKFQKPPGFPEHLRNTSGTPPEHLWEALRDQLPPSPPQGLKKCERPDRPILDYFCTTEPISILSFVLPRPCLYYLCTTEPSSLLFLYYQDQSCIHSLLHG